MQSPLALPGDTADLKERFIMMDGVMVQSCILSRYLNTAAELQKYAACLHLQDTVPDAIIVDDISSFLEVGYVTMRRRLSDIMQ